MTADVKHIVVVSAGLSQPSSTRLLADRLAEATRGFLEADGRAVEIEVIELREKAHDITNNLLTGFPSPDLRSAIDAVEACDGVIAVTPIFSASYSGLFKSFFDVIDRDALAGKPVLVAATGGTARHSLALDYALRPLFSYLRASIVPTAVFAASDDWGGSDDGELVLRIGRAAREFADAVERYEHPSAGFGAFVVPFEQQLARGGGPGRPA